jgi:hypothetical protein
MRQTDLYRSGKPPELLSRNCFELLVKSITAFVTLLCVEIPGLGPTSAMVHAITVENAGFELALVQWGCSATNFQITPSSIIGSSPATG